MGCSTVPDVNTSDKVTTVPDDIPLSDTQYQGLLYGEVNQIAFDQNDVLWIDNMGKAASFLNGSFRFFDRQSDNLPASAITKIYVDNCSKKWFGTKSGEIYTYDDSVWKIMPDPGLGQIWDILQDKSGDLWVLSERGIWRYKNDNVYKPFILGKNEYTMLAEADNGDLLIAGQGTGHLLKHTGETIEALELSFPDLFILQMIYDDIHNRVYLEIGNGGRYKEGIYSYENGELIELPSKLLRISYNLNRNSKLIFDRKGTLWANWRDNDNEYRLARLIGDQWEEFEIPTSLKNAAISDIAAGADGNLWFSGVYYYPESCIVDDSLYGPMAKYDGANWIFYHTLPTNPLQWWNYSDLSTIMDVPINDADISDILAAPAQYWGKKIRIIGHLQPAPVYGDVIQPATIFDINGHDLGIEIKFHPELYSLLKETDIITDLTSEETREFIGYIQYWRSTIELFITEIYPFSYYTDKRDDLAEKYRDYLTAKESDKKEIRALIESWIAKRSTAQNTPESELNQTWTEQQIFSEFKQLKIGDIHIDYSLICFDGDSAIAYIYGLRINPIVDSFKSTDFTSHYEIENSNLFKFLKVNNSWQIKAELLYLMNRYPSTTAIPVNNLFPIDGPIAEPTCNTVYKPESLDNERYLK